MVGCGQKRPFYPSFVDGSLGGEEAGVDDDGVDDCSPSVEKKRRLTFDQVRSLERNFELENKLEPERKMQLAKQLERDYEVLSLDYNRMKAEYETIVLEKEKLKTEVNTAQLPSFLPSFRVYYHIVLHLLQSVGTR